MQSDSNGKNIPPELQMAPDAGDMHPLLHKILLNLKPIAFVLGTILLLTGIYSGFRLYQKSSGEKARAELGAILVEKAGPDQVTALEAFVDKAPSALKTGARVELALAQGREKMFDKAAKTWASIAESKDDKIVLPAKLGEAGALLSDGKAKEALALLEGLKKDVPEGYQQILAYQTGVAADMAGENQKAITAFEEAKSKMEKDSIQTALIDSKIARLKRGLAN